MSHVESVRNLSGAVRRTGLRSQRPDPLNKRNQPTQVVLQILILDQAGVEFVVPTDDAPDWLYILFEWHFETFLGVGDLADRLLTIARSRYSFTRISRDSRTGSVKLLLDRSIDRDSRLAMWDDFFKHSRRGTHSANNPPAAGVTEIVLGERLLYAVAMLQPKKARRVVSVQYRFHVRLDDLSHYRQWITCRVSVCQAKPRLRFG